MKYMLFSFLALFMLACYEDPVRTPVLAMFNMGTVESTYDLPGSSDEMMLKLTNDSIVVKKSDVQGLKTADSRWRAAFDDQAHHLTDDNYDYAIIEGSKRKLKFRRL